jgi:methyl-accepting chemotaxis protein
MDLQSARGISLKVGSRVLLTFGVCTLFVLAAAAFGYWRLSSIIGFFDEQVMSRQTNAIDVEAVETNFKKQVQEWKDTLLRGKKPEALDKHWAAFQQRESDVRNVIDRLRRTVADQEATKLLEQFRSAHQGMGDAYRRGLAEFKDHGFDSAVGDKAVAGIDRAPTELLTKARDRLISIAAAEAAEAREQARRTAWITALLFAGTVVAGALVFLLAIRKTVVEPLTTSIDALSALAEGNTSVDVKGLGRRDEIGRVAQAIQRFKERMIEAERLRSEQEELRSRGELERKAALARIADEFEATVAGIVTTVSTASGELEHSAGKLTATAQRGQELSTLVASASEETSANVQSVAAATEELSLSTVEISRQVQRSAQIAFEAVGQARGTTARVSELSKAAGRIGDVVELINNIAEQTNLLALNATIEAARAGEAGRGFAVVAAEVKTLAEQTAKATGEIGQQITGIQAATGDSVTAIGEISGTIERLSEISSAIAAAIEEQGASTQEISRNVQHAAHGTGQVSSNISDVQRGASETGSASSQVLSAAQSLTAESRRLQAEMGRFLQTVRSA